jgi:hypothetical protein
MKGMVLDILRKCKTQSLFSVFCSPNDGGMDIPGTGAQC